MLFAPWMIACTESGSDTDTAGLDTGERVTEASPFAPCGEAEATITYTKLESDTRRYAGIDAVVDTWSLDLRCDGVPYEYPLGGTPAFRVVMPVGADTGTPRPLALVMHPGTVDVDDEEYPEGRYGGQCAEDHGPSRVDHYLDMSVFTPYFVAQGGVVAIPVNSFCDLWMGLGPADPVDPRHGGLMLAKLVSDWMLTGQEHVVVDEDRIAVFGARFPTVGASLYATLFPEVDVLLPVGGPSDMVRYYEEEGYCQWDRERCEATTVHIWGGPPRDDDGGESALYPRYRDSSLVLALAADRYALPTFHVYNDFDVVSPTIQHEDVAPALAAALDPRGIRWAEYNMANTDLPHDGVHNGPTSSLLSSWFILGMDVAAVEGEDPLARGSVGTAGQGSQENMAASGAAVVGSRAEEGAGVLFEAPVPMAVAAGDQVAAAFHLKLGPGEGTAVTLSLLEDGAVVASRDLSPRDLLPAEVGEHVVDFVTNFETSTLRATAKGGTFSARVSAWGTADVDLDVVLLGVQ